MFKLASLAQEQGYRFEFFDIVDSTNNIAQDRINEALIKGDIFASDKLFIIAAQQSGGRGRRGRFWHSPRGNLYVSLVLCQGFTEQNVAQLGFVASLSLLEAIYEIAKSFVRQDLPQPILQGKWPNDILLKGAKLGGTMIELVAKDDKLAAILGMGVNIVEKYAYAGYETAYLQEYGIASSAEELFAVFSHYWAQNFAQWAAGGAAIIRDKWLSFAAGLGQEIKVKKENQVIEGRFMTIDHDFCLLLKQNDGQLAKISSGDVFLQGAASLNCGR